MKQINSKEIKEAILAEAKKIKRKKELFSEMKKIAKELVQLNEWNGMAGSFGFESPGDKSKASKTGFVQDDSQPQVHISHTLQELENEMHALKEEEVADDENNVDKLKEENVKLKEQLSKIQEAMAGQSKVDGEIVK